MIAFLIARLLQSLGVMLAVALVAFAMFRYVGDPVNNMVGGEASHTERVELRQSLGLDDNFLIQYARYVGRAVRGEFGSSFQHRRPVADLVRERLPATLELAVVATLMALVLGIVMGVYTGLHRDSWLSRIFMTVSLIGISLPTFFTGILLIMVFSVQLKWLPAFGRGDVVNLGWWASGLLSVEGIKSILMPAFTLSLFQMTLVVRLVRAEMVEVLRTNYIKFARARGLPNRVVHFGHALKNTLLPVITITGLQLGSIIAFAVITETVFQWPGMGFLFIQAVAFGDVPVMATYLVLISLVFVVINLTVDLLYAVVDPRLNLGRSSAQGH